MTDATILDAPETPAPLFAWRALKGVFLGSPTDDDEENKENAKHARPASDFQLRSCIEAASSPSPSKRRRIHQYSSPAKSILRTPGVPTPRRQKPNVTFKDVRISISPELALKAVSPVKARAADGNKTEKAILTKPPLTGNVKRKISSQDTSTDDAVQIPITGISDVACPPNTAASHFDFESYKASTEREMKRLVRYGQKMREYARMQDEENTRLRVALENLRRENEEIKKREEKRDYQRLRQNDGLGDPGSMAADDRPRRGETDVKTAQVANAYRASSFETQKAVKEPRTSTVNVAAIDKTSVRKSTAEGAVGGQKLCKDMENRPVRQTSVRLPPDRLAAARERIRLKAEERRKASEVGTQSQVDWAGL